MTKIEIGTRVVTKYGVTGKVVHMYSGPEGRSAYIRRDLDDRKIAYALEDLRVQEVEEVVDWEARSNDWEARALRAERALANMGDALSAYMDEDSGWADPVLEKIVDDVTEALDGVSPDDLGPLDLLARKEFDLDDDEPTPEPWSTEVAR